MSLLTLLKQGCAVEWPDGFALRGDPSDGYINILHDGYSLGLWILSKEGLKNALDDIKKQRKESSKANVSPW